MLLFVAFPCLAVGGIILLLTNMQVNTPFIHYTTRTSMHTLFLIRANAIVPLPHRKTVQL